MVHDSNQMFQFVFHHNQIQNSYFNKQMIIQLQNKETNLDGRDAGGGEMQEVVFQVDNVLVPGRIAGRVFDCFYQVPGPHVDVCPEGNRLWRWLWCL